MPPAGCFGERQLRQKICRWSAPLLTLGLPHAEEIAKGATLDQVWSSIADEGQLLTQNPSTNRILVGAERPGGFIDRIGVMDLDEPAVESASHQLRPPLSMSSRMSWTLQAVILGPSFTGRG